MKEEVQMFWIIMLGGEGGGEICDNPGLSGAPLGSYHG